MNALAKKAMAAGNNAACWVYRRSSGRIGGTARGLPVLLLTVPGRKTGKQRSVPVAYFEHANGYLVAATAGGSKTSPQWIRNLAATGQAHIEIRGDHQDVDVRIPEGNERDQLWNDVVLSTAPSFAKYEEKAGRIIEVALLTPH